MTPTTFEFAQEFTMFAGQTLKRSDLSLTCVSLNGQTVTVDVGRQSSDTQRLNLDYTQPTIIGPYAIQLTGTDNGYPKFVVIKNS